MVRPLPIPDLSMPEFIALIAALPFPEIDPVAIRLGPLAVHWYGIGYVAGILIGWRYMRRLAENPALWAGGKPAIRAIDLDDFLAWGALGIVLGGRLGYILFYDFARFAANPLDMVAIWQGGMSFHGGALGTLFAMLMFARSRGISPASLIDVVAAGVAPAIGLVRVTNFINSELWGRVTDLPWGVVFPNGGPDPRHPSQLYEALLEGVLLFIVLRIATHKFGSLKHPGQTGGLFVAGYGLCRLAVEFFREPDAHIGYLMGTDWLTMGMVLSLPMLLVGGAIVAITAKRAK